jgi:hypothetical protein
MSPILHRSAEICSPWWPCREIQEKVQHRIRLKKPETHISGFFKKKTFNNTKITAQKFYKRINWEKTTRASSFVQALDGMLQLP